MTCELSLTRNHEALITEYGSEDSTGVEWMARLLERRGCTFVNRKCRMNLMR